MKLSILIPTLDIRKRMLETLLADLWGQAKRFGLEHELEVLTSTDDGKKKVGAKRNELIERAQGEFVAFVDDDDEVADDYVRLVCETIAQNPGADCIGFRGIFTRPGGAHQRQVVYSVNYKSGFEKGGVYCRPPCHLTPVRRSIASRFKYGDVSLGEDAGWSNSVLAEKVLNKEAFVDKVLYHYRFNPKASGTQQNWNVPVPNPSIADRWKVVILSARAKNLAGCLAALFANEPGLSKDRVVVVDDGAFDEFDRSLYPGIVWTKGKKPFVYARNANIGITTAQTPVFLLNDDAILASRFGLSSMAYSAKDRPEVGISSAAISGLAGSPAQTPAMRLAGTKYVPNVSFVCAYLTKGALEKVGLLDERFTGYGFEDNDFCYRAAKAKLVSAVYDGCLVVHDRQEASSFRSRPDWRQLMDVNRAHFEEKWGKNVLAPKPVPEAVGGTPQELFDREEYDAALPYFVTASSTQENPIDRSQAMLMAARCHAGLGRWDVAETWFDAARKIAPDRREIPFFRGVALVKLRDLEEASEAFKECLAIPSSKRPFSSFDVTEVWDGTRPQEGIAFCAEEIARAKQEAAQGRA